MYWVGGSDARHALNNYPTVTDISIIGGGRWARTIAGVICGLVDPSIRVVLCSRHNGREIAAWIEKKGIGDRLSINEDWSFGSGNAPSLVVVANRVADHRDAAIKALANGCPLLIEKPVALSERAILDIAAKAGQMCVPVAASHVFLFARYIEAFVGLVQKAGALKSVSLEWIDGHADIRDGESKSYDPRITVFDDVLPHLVPLVISITGSVPGLNSLDVRRGGAEVSINARAGSVPVAIEIQRDGVSRRRRIVVGTAAGIHELDFSREPGTIALPDGRHMDGDPLWNEKLRPLGTMLSAFLGAAQGASLDERLSLDGALRSAQLADAVRARYALHQANWFSQAFEAAPPAHQNYALRELGLPALPPYSIGPFALQSTLEQEAGRQ